MLIHMQMKPDKKQNLLVGALFALLATGLLGLVLFSYMFGAGDTSFMDLLGWLYFLSSSLMHAALVCAVPFLLLFLPLSLAGVRTRVSIPILGTLYSLLILLAVVNRFVFQIYHFHINGFVLDMLFSPGAGDIFVFSFWLYVKAAVILLCVAGAVVLLAWLAAKWARRSSHATLRYPLLGLLAAALLSQGLHIYGAATLRTSILEADAFLPYYFPVSMNSALDRWGIIDKKQIATINISERRSPLNYPLRPLQTDSFAERPNIVVIAIDSWNFRTLTPECMPNLWRFKEDNEYFANHLSSSNGTRGGIFGLFTGLSSYYWKSFEYSSLRPVLVDQLVDAHYNIQLFPSATFQSPPFDRMFFKGMDTLSTSTQGASVYERDCNLTRNFSRFLASRSPQPPQPFFAFLFYDLAHAIALPADKNTRFTPAWDFADYSRLTNSTDPTAYFNLYRNCVYQIDSLIGIVLRELDERDLLWNTIVVVTGDHGQEFNENHKNYWGHAGNYTKYQIQVPLILHYYHNDPGTVFTHRTTHYDIVPTLLWLALGVTNAPSDYSMGTFLGDTASRGWHIVGNDLNYAFITDDGHIIEKQGNGNVKIYDSALNLQPPHPLPPRHTNDLLLRRTPFYK